MLNLVIYIYPRPLPAPAPAPAPATSTRDIWTYSKFLVYDEMENISMDEISI